MPRTMARKHRGLWTWIQFVFRCDPVDISIGVVEHGIFFHNANTVERYVDGTFNTSTHYQLQWKKIGWVRVLYFILFSMRLLDTFASVLFNIILYSTNGMHSPYLFNWQFGTMALYNLFVFGCHFQSHIFLRSKKAGGSVLQQQWIITKPLHILMQESQIMRACSVVSNTGEQLPTIHHRCAHN